MDRRTLLKIIAELRFEKKSRLKGDGLLLSRDSRDRYIITSGSDRRRNYDARGHVEICGNRGGNAVGGRVAAKRKKKKEEKNRSEFTLTPANEREW